jgi:hypothetical protein
MTAIVSNAQDDNFFADNFEVERIGIANQRRSVDAFPFCDALRRAWIFGYARENGSEARLNVFVRPSNSCSLFRRGCLQAQKEQAPRIGPSLAAKIGEHGVDGLVLGDRAAARASSMALKSSSLAS